MPDSKLDQARVLTGEQTNSSIVFPSWVLPGAPDGCLLKVLRYPVPELHPDVEVPEALHRVGFTQVPKFLGTLDVGPQTVAILSQWIPNADDGFELACANAGRGESFAGPAHNLGETIAQLHDALALALPCDQNLNPAELVASLQQRADVALTEVPELAAYQSQITALYQKLNRDSASHLQRIHGDLHLGQLLYRDGEWFVLDFEGEPLRPAAERRRPDLPERDVAGMIRSFSYAAAVGHGSPEWAAQATQAFLDGYQQHRALNQKLLSALVLDKALYEAVYEKRHRPDWLPIPMAAISDLIAQNQVGSGTVG